MELHAGDHVAGYRIVELAGRGSSGAVYRATDEDGAHVAIKIAHRREPAAAQRLVSEAELLERLRHRNLLGFRELVDDGAEVALVTSWVPGQSLADLLATGPLPIKRTMTIARQLGDVLDYLHNMGVVHRDLSPANVLIGPDDVVTLIDLGLGRTADEAGMTTDASLAGTPRYMAPEVIRGSQSGPYADQYSVAAILHEMIAGRPWLPDGDVMATVLHHQLSTEPEPLSEIDPYVPPSVEAAVLRGLNKEPRERFNSVTAMVEAATGAVGAAPSTVVTSRELAGSAPEAEPTAAASVLGGPIGFALVGLVLLAALGFGIWLLANSDPQGGVATGSVPTTQPERESDQAASAAVVVPTIVATVRASEGPAWPAGTARSLACNLLEQPDFDTSTLPVDFFGDPPGRERMIDQGGLDNSGVLVIGQADQFGQYAEKIAVVPGETYTFIVNAGRTGDVADAKIGIDWLDPGSSALDGDEPKASIPQNFSTISLSATAPPGAGFALPWLFKDASPGVVLVDEMVFARTSCEGLDSLPTSGQ